MERFFIRNKKGSLMEVTEKMARKHKKFGHRPWEGGHTVLYVNKKGKLKSTGICMICGCKEGNYTSECSGSQLTEDVLQRVELNEIDYIYGRWVEGVKNIYNINNEEDINKNMEIFKQEFKEDIENETPLGLRILKNYDGDIDWINNSDEYAPDGSDI